MLRSWVVMVVAVGCSSGTSEALSTETPLSFGACPVEQTPTADRFVPPPARNLPGLFGTNGLQPRQEPQAGKTCQAARVTLDITSTKILDAPKPVAATGVPRVWDRKTEPAGWARIVQRYGLNQRHRDQLGRDGFVVAKGATHWNFVEAYHEIFQSQLPIYARVIGGNYRRAIPTQPHPDGLTDLPVVAAMFGPRVNADTAALAPIIQPAVPQRIAVAAADVAYLLGHDRAKRHLAKELAEFPELDKQLAVARSALDARLKGDDMYSMWLKAIRALAKPAAGTTPSFMKGDGFADLRMSSAIASYGQLRSNYELMESMAYLGSGCEIPDGYVEPAADTYDALIAYAERGKAILAKIDPKDVADAQGYYTRLATTLRVLRAIVTTELAGQPLTTAQKEWLSMVVEIVKIDASGAPPTYAGWYFDLFRNFGDATREPDFLTSFAQNVGETMYLGGSDPRIGVFVVDTGGPPRVMVGPIAHAWEASSPTAQGRLVIDDADDTKPRPTMSEPWSAGYTIEGAKSPKIVVEDTWREDARGFEVIAATTIGRVTLKLLDHHRVPFASQTKVIGAGRTTFRFSATQMEKAEVVQLVHGTFNDWAQRQTGGDSTFSFWLTTRAEYEAITNAFPETN